MLEFVVPAAFAIFIWWFATGIVLLLDGMPRKTFAWSILISAVLAISALFGLSHTAGQISMVNAYCAFTCALLVWGWHELTFLTGWLTGPRKIACTAASGWPRFRQAVAAILWHELAIFGAGMVILAITWGQPNQVGTWTFGVLWVMRTSAKLNLFFGVRNLSEEFLPAHLTYMGGYFRRRSMNAFFPPALLAAIVVLVLMILRIPDATDAQAVGWILVATMLSMAILEHFLLILPLPSTALWRWALRNRTSPSADRTVVPVGATDSAGHR